MTRIAIAGVILAAWATAFPALAIETRVGDITIIDPWSRATPGLAKNGIAYLTIRNDGRLRDRLVAVHGETARRTALHVHEKSGIVMRMRSVSTIAIAPGTSVKLRPGGYHIMLFGIREPFREGMRFKLTLVFENAGATMVTVAVGKAGAMGP